MQVSPDDLVWIEGKSTIWTHLKDVQELESLWTGEGRSYAANKRTGEEPGYQNTGYSANIPFRFDATPSLNDSYAFRQQEMNFSREVDGERFLSNASQRNVHFLSRFSWIAVVAGIALVGILITKIVRNSKDVMVMPKEAASSMNIPNDLDNTENFQNALTKEIIMVPDSSKAVTKKVKPKNLKKLVKIENNEYRVGLFGGINNLKLTIENNSDELLDRVVIQIDYLKPNGGIINSDTISAKMIRAQDSKTIDVPDTKRGVKITHKVIKVEAHEFKATMSEV